MPRKKKAKEGAKSGVGVREKHEMEQVRRFPCRLDDLGESHS
jgi:hypothetical protein